MTFCKRQSCRDRKQVSCCQTQGVGGGADNKGTGDNFGDDWNVVYLDYGVYMTVCVCQNSLKTKSKGQHFPFAIATICNSTKRHKVSHILNQLNSTQCELYVNKKDKFFVPKLYINIFFNVMSIPYFIT